METCEVCERPIYDRPYHSEYFSMTGMMHYCSRDCLLAHLGMECPVCGKVFCSTSEGYKEEYDSDDEKCCSKYCYDKKNHTVSCPNCGRTFMEGEGYGQYCSKYCCDQDNYTDQEEFSISRQNSYQPNIEINSAEASILAAKVEVEAQRLANEKAKVEAEAKRIAAEKAKAEAAAKVAAEKKAAEERARVEIENLRMKGTEIACAVPTINVLDRYINVEFKNISNKSNFDSQGLRVIIFISESKIADYKTIDLFKDPRVMKYGVSDCVRLEGHYGNNYKSIPKNKNLQNCISYVERSYSKLKDKTYYAIVTLWEINYKDPSHMHEVGRWGIYDCEIIDEWFAKKNAEYAAKREKEEAEQKKFDRKMYFFFGGLVIFTIVLWIGVWILNLILKGM